jgi:hypothetical protein
MILQKYRPSKIITILKHSRRPYSKERFYSSYMLSSFSTYAYSSYML